MPVHSSLTMPPITATNQQKFTIIHYTTRKIGSLNSYQFSVSYLFVKKKKSELKYFSFTLKTKGAYFSETSASIYRTATSIRIISTVGISSLSLT